jgi:hypothetical protein
MATPGRASSAQLDDLVGDGGGPGPVALGAARPVDVDVDIGGR